MQHHTTDHTLITYTSYMLLTLTIMTKPPEQNLEAVTGDVFKNFANFTGKHLCWSFFFTKLQAFRPATLLKETPTQVFSCEICEIHKNTYLKYNCERPLLCIDFFMIY